MRIVALVLLLCSLTFNAQAARGFGSGFGTGLGSDRIVTTYATAITSSMSFSVWFWLGSPGVGQRILDHATGSNDCLINEAATLISFSCKWSGTSGNFTILNPSSSAYHHLAIIYDASSAANIPVMYIDNVAQTVTTATPPVGTFSPIASAFIIGNRGDTVGGFIGKIAHPAYWSNTLLTPAEVSALAKGASPLKVRNSSLAFYCPLYGKTTVEACWGTTRTTGTVTGSAVQPDAPVTGYPILPIPN